MALTQFDVDQQKQTMRQAALGNIIQGIQGLEEKNKTKRAMALEDQKIALEYKKAGYDVSPEMIAQNRAEEPSGLAKLFGAKSPEKVDLTANRTQEYKNKLSQDAEDRKFKRELQETDQKFKQANYELDKKFKMAQMGSMNTENQKKIAEMNDLSSGNKFRREMTQKQMQDIGTKNANLLGVKNAMDAALTQLNDKNLSQEDKIKVGQGLLKLLNSAEGSDAVGAEEAKRIGSYLEHKMFNVFEPGSMFGRDLDLFTEQVKNNSDLLGDRITRNESAITGLGSGASMTELAAKGSQNRGENEIALQPVNFRGADPKVNFSPANIPNMSPIQNAHAGNLKNVDNNSLMSRRDELLKKKGGR